MPEKVVLAYSGGLDTSIIIPWLKENYGCDLPPLDRRRHVLDALLLQASGGGVDGELEIRHADKVAVLQAGDSVYFDASEMHSYQGHSDTPTRAIVVTTPPRL